MESTAAHLEQLSTAWEEVYNTILDTDTINELIDGFTSLVGILNSFLSSLGGGMSTLANLGVIGVNVFSNQIGKAIEQQIINTQILKANEEALNLVTETAQAGQAMTNNENINQAYQEQIDRANELLALQKELSSEKYNELASLSSEITELELIEAKYIEIQESGKTIEETTNELKIQNSIVDEQAAQWIKLNQIKKEITAYDEQDTITKSQQTGQYIDQNTQLDEIVISLMEVAETEQERNQLEAAYDSLVQNGLSDQQSLEFILNRQKQALDQAKAVQTDLNIELKAQKELENNNLAVIEQQAKAKKQQFSTETAQKAEQQRISEITKGLSSAVMLGNSLSNIVKTINNDSLSGWEKFSQIASNLVFVLPMVIRNFSSITSLLPNLAIQLGIVGTTAEAAEMGVLGLTTSLIAAAAPFIAIAAAIGGVVAIAKICIDEYNSLANSAEKAAETANDLADANDAVSESLETLKSTIDTYEDAVDALEECTEGTEEWKDALEETNDAALDLINSFSNLSATDLSELYSRNDNGLIVIDEDKLDELVNQQEALANSSELASGYGDYDAAIKQASSDLLDATREAAKYANAGYETETTQNSVTLQQEEEVKDVHLQLAEEWHDILEENADALTDLTQGEFEDAVEQLGLDLAGLSDDQIAALQTATESMAEEADAAAAKLKLIAELEVSSALGDDYDTEVQEMVANQLTSLEEQYTEEWLDKLTGSGISKVSGANNDIYEETLKALQAAGYDYDKQKSNAVRGTDNNRSLAFLDENGEEVVRTAEWIADTLGAYQAMAEVSDNAEGAAQALSNLDEAAEQGSVSIKDATNPELSNVNVTEGIAEGIKDYITSGNLESLTETDYSDLQAALQTVAGDGGTISDSVVQAYLSSLFDVGTEELASYLGEDYTQDFLDAINDYETALADVGSDLRAAAKSAFDEVTTDKDLDLTAKETVADTLKDALAYGGEEALSAVDDMYSTLTADNMEDFLAVVDEYDDAWGDVNITTFTTALEDAGVEISWTTEELEAFIEAMNATGEATATTIDSLQETYATLADIIDGIETGDALSADDYSSLLENMGEYSELISTYFTELMDGTYKLTGSAEDLQEVVNAIEQSEFLDKSSELTSQVKQYKELSEIDWDNLSDSVSNYNALINSSSEATTGALASINNSISEVAKENISSILDQIQAYQDLTDTTLIEIGTLEDYRQKLEENTQLTEEEIHDIEDALNEIGDSEEDWAESIEDLEEQLNSLDLMLAYSCDTYNELKAALDEGVISVQAFSQAYENLWEAERQEDLDTDEIEEYADYIQEIAKESEEFSKDLEENEDDAEDLAIQIMNMNDAIDDLADNWEEWSDILSKSSKESQEYAEAIISVKDAMSKLLDIDNEFISSDFVVQHMEDIEAAATGDADAIDRLRAAALDDIIINLELDDSSITNEQLALLVADLQSQLDAMDDITVGTSIDAIDDADFIDSCNAMIAEAGLTADEVNALFSGMGYSVTYATEPQSVTTTIPEYTTYATPEIASYITLSDGREVQGYKTVSWTEQTGVHTVEGETSAFAMETSEPGTTVVPQITSITKKATGSSNNYSSKNSGGKSPGSSSSSGSSGSGSSSEDEPEILDYLEDEADRYHDINLRLQAISVSLSRLQSQEKKLFGSNLIENLNAQLATLEDEIDATKEKIKIAQQEAAEYQSTLASQGVTFDADGYITNYASIMSSKLAYVNQAIANYNAMSAEEQEAYEDTLDDIKEDYEDFVQMISDYDTLISETIPGLEDDIQDALDEEIEIQITKFTMEVEIRLDMEEAEKDWNEFYRKVILGISDDDILGTATQDYKDILSYYNTAGTGTGSVQTLTKQLNNTLEQLQSIDKTGTSSVYGDNYDQALEDLQTYYTELMTELKDVEDLIDDIEESYLDMIDEAIDAFDDHLEQYEYMNDLLEHDMNIIELMYGDDAYSQLATYYQKIEDNNNAQLAFLRQRVDYAYEMMQAETDPEAQEKWMEEWEDALSELNDTVEDSLQNIIDKYVNAVNEVIDELNDKVTNGLGLDYVSEEWDLINEKADIYLDEINAMYEVQNLQSKWLDAIDSTDSIAQQQKLNELMEEQISYLEEKGELTDYDIERAELEYEIALKQIQLEEAQQDSSSMRLRRDSSGNYSYEYTTDEDAVADAQSELLTLQNQLYNLDVEEYSNNLNEIYNAYNEFQQKLLELYEDQTLSEEERAEQEALLMEYYGDIINSLVEENSVIRTNLQDSAFSLLASMYANDSDNFAAMTSINMESYQNMVSAFKSLNAESLADFNNMTDQQLEWVASLTDEQLEFLTSLTDEELELLSSLTDEELQKYQNMTAEELAASTTLTDEQIALLTGMTAEQYALAESMTSDQYSLIEGLTEDEISFLQSLTEAEREQFSTMTDEQRQNFYDFATGASTDYQSMVEAMEGYLDSLSEDTQQTMLDEIVPGWNSGVQEMADNFGENGMTGICEDALEDLADATEDYQDDLDELADAAGVDLDKVADGYDEVEEQIQDVIDAEDDVIDTYAKEIDAIKDLMSTLDDLISKYASAKSAAEAAATAAYKYWQSANSSAASAASSSSSSSSSTSTTKSTSSSGSSSSGSSSSSNSTQGNGSVNIGDRVMFNSGSYYYDSYGTSPSGSAHHGQYVYVTNYKTDNRAKPVHISTGSTLGNGDLGWVTKSQISGYDTGGYTGDWDDGLGSDGKGGRLAFLHQKELVLNESDTQNLLTAVSVVSDVAGLLNNLNSSMLSNITSLLDNLGSFKFDSNNDNGVVQQNVHIEATFGDSTASEIETALNNLINSASQYANKKGI